MFRKFIERPVLATVVSALLAILGVIGLTKLPLQQFPDIAPPAVQVAALYPGANAETVLRSVAPSLEESINGVENMTYMSSTASNDGTLTITVYFKLGTNPDQAQVNVQNRVAQATSQLPAEVIQQGITTTKQQNSLIMVVGMYTEDEKKYDQAFVANYAQINIIPEIRRISGVGSAAIFGGVKDYSMRIWPKPSQLATYHLTPNDLIAAIQDKSLEAAPGKFGESSNQAFEYIIKYKGKLNRPEEYENIAIRIKNDGSVLRLKDVARVEFGTYTYTSVTRNNGKKGIDIAVIQLAGSNANQIQIAINKLMAKASKDFPAGVKYDDFYSTKISLDQSIDQVEHTLLEAFILVFIVVFLFLQDFRSTLIPAIAVPVAIIGTFFFMQLFGFTINLLTLFAMILAIGIVVDDAIVVVEAVHSKMEHQNLAPKPATIEAMHEISGAIMSMTLVMAAVFLPIGFLEGSTGVFFRQFAFTMAIAIVISAVNALTLSPALAALFLKNNHSSGKVGEKQSAGFSKKFFAGFNGGFTALSNRYLGGLRFLIRYKWVGLTGLALISVATFFLVKRTPTGFIPSEDQGFVAIALATPSGTSLARTSAIFQQAEDTLKQEEFSGYINALPGYNLLTSSNSPSAGIGFVVLKPTAQRGKVKDLNAIMALINQKLTLIKGGNFFVFTFPTVPGFSNVEALDLILQDKTAGTLNKFSGVANTFIGKLMKQKEIAVAFTSFKADYPQLQLEVDDDKANQLGVNVKDILQTMQAYFGGTQAADFNRFGKYYRVVVQADISDRADPSAINNVFVKNKLGGMVPINTLVKLTRVYGSETASRYNLFNSIEVNVIPKPGYSSGDAISAIQKLAAKELPHGFSYEFSGQTREEIASNGQAAIIFIMCLVFVYFILSAQYESYILPLAVILSIPAGVFGVFVSIGLKGIENNIYVQVALIMLIGLLAKNAILIVEFAVQRRKAGKSLVAAALEAAKLRLRPIVMTSLAFIFGLFPMSIATGPSAQGNHSISFAAVGGMISGVFLGLFIIPVLFIIFQSIQERVTGISLAPKMKLSISGLCLILVVLSACKVSKDIPVPKPEVPESFRGGATAAGSDTSNIANLPWKAFFSERELFKLIDTAIVKNFDMQIALQNIEASRLLFRQVKWDYLPATALGVNANSSRPSDNSLDGLSLAYYGLGKHIEDYSADLSVSWEADIWGKIRNKGKAALATYLQTIEARKAVQTQIVISVSKGYINLLMLDEQLEIARKNIRLNDSTLAIVELQYDAGQVTSLAVQQAQAQELTAAQLVPELEQDISIQENALSVLTGQLPGGIERKSSFNRFPLPSNLSAGLPADLVSYRPDVRSAELALEIANAKVGIAKAAMYPALRITADGGINSFKASEWFNIPSALFGVVAGSVLQPLFDQKKLSTQYKVSEVEREKTVLTFRQSVLNAVGETSDALIKIQKLQEQQTIAKKRTRTLEQAISNANQLFRNGMATYLEVITAQANVLQSELTLAGIERDELIAEADLYRALGGGWK